MTEEGQVVIVTGSAGGIGRHVAKSFASEGYSLVVADVKPLATISQELDEIGVEHLAVPTDVSNPNAARELMDRTVEHFGHVDVLVNMAAIVTHFLWGITPWPRIRDLDPDFWNRVIQTNLGGTFLCSKFVLPYMEARRTGHIVNTTGGSRPEAFGSSPYVVSKDAIRTFTRFVSEEEREFDVCVVAMGPGAQIANEEAPEEAQARMPGPEAAGNRFVLAARAPMELSGRILTVENGVLAPSSY